MSWAEAGDTSAGPGYGAAGHEPGRLAAGAQRRIAVPPSVTRQHLLRAIRELAFELKTEQFSLLEAVRGSRFGGITLSAARVPVALRIGLEEADGGSRVIVLLADRLPGKMGRNWGVTSVYIELFGSVLTAVDAVLTRLDPAAAATFTPWWRDTGAGDVAMMQNAASLAGKLSRQASRLMDSGAANQRQASVSRAGVETFVFETPEAVAEVPTELADGMLMVGALIASRPGAMPPKLVAQVQSLVFRVEEHLASAAVTGPGAPGNGTRFVVGAEDVPVVTFLHQQARLRGVLPVRNLRTCTTCRLEKVTNPEMERLQERTRRTRDLATSLSAVVTPYVLAGRLVQMNSKNPEFACPRCQGMDADETVVTYCQRCGDRRAETALRTCSKCQFDFRSLVGGEQLWRKREAPAAAQPGAPAPAALPPTMPHQVPTYPMPPHQTPAYPMPHQQGPSYPPPGSPYQSPPPPPYGPPPGTGYAPPPGAGSQPYGPPPGTGYGPPPGAGYGPPPGAGSHPAGPPAAPAVAGPVGAGPPPPGYPVGPTGSVPEPPYRPDPEAEEWPRPPGFAQ